MDLIENCRSIFVRVITISWRCLPSVFSVKFSYPRRFVFEFASFVELIENVRPSGFDRSEVDQIFASDQRSFSSTLSVRRRRGGSGQRRKILAIARMEFPTGNYEARRKKFPGLSPELERGRRGHLIVVDRVGSEPEDVDEKLVVEAARTSLGRDVQVLRRVRIRNGNRSEDQRYALNVTNYGVVHK